MADKSITVTITADTRQFMAVLKITSWAMRLSPILGTRLTLKLANAMLRFAKMRYRIGNGKRRKLPGRVHIDWDENTRSGKVNPNK